MEIRDDLVRTGLGSFDRAHAAVEEAARAARTAIEGVDTAAVFGTDTPGQQFLVSYLEGGGPAELLFGQSGGGGILQVLADGADQMQTNLDEAMTREDLNRAAVAAVAPTA